MINDFFIKNMVCDRCIKVVKDELALNNIELKGIELGRITIQTNDVMVDKAILESILKNNGFSLINDPEEYFVEQLKIELLSLFQKLPLQIEGKLSEFLSSKFNRDYSKISKMFSVQEQLTLEKYFIKLKIEKVKELIQSKGVNFTEISQLLDYSNVNHLSKQFKNETGMSLSDYKSHSINTRRSLDKIV